MRDCASANLRSNTYIEIIAIHVRDTLILIFTSYDFHRLFRVYVLIYHTYLFTPISGFKANEVISQ